MAKIKRAQPKPTHLAVDTETTGLSVWHGDRPFALSTCDNNGNQLYCEWPVDPFTRQVNYENRNRAGAFDRFRELYLDPTITKVFHNSKFDLRMIHHAFGLWPAGRYEDTMFAARVVYNFEQSIGLKQLAEKYLEMDTEDEDELHAAINQCRFKAGAENRKQAKKPGDLFTGTVGPIKVPKSSSDPEAVAEYTLAHFGKALPHWKFSDGLVEFWAQFPWAWKLGEKKEQDMWLPRAVADRGLWFAPEELARIEGLCEKYCRLDTVRTMLLWAMYDRLLDEEQGRGTYQVEMDLAPMLYEMEEKGMGIDRDIVFRERESMVVTLERCHAALCEYNEGPLNINSADQVREFLYDKFGVPITKETHTGLASTDSRTLQHYVDEFPVIASLFEYRAAEKGLSTFMDRYLKFMVEDPDNPGHYLLHASFNQVGTKTSRLSCQNPNLQQTAEVHSGRSLFPIQGRTPLGPRPGYWWYPMDYKQLEVRIFADLADEPVMLGAIRNNRDLHTECTNNVWGGRDNPKGIFAAVDVLELRLVSPETAEVVDLWNECKRREKKAGLDPNGDTPENLAIRNRFADEWLAQYEWDYAAAEKSINKKNYRNRAKMIMFTRLYGGGPNQIAELLKEPFHVAKQLMDDYDSAFPKLVQFITDTTQHVRLNGFITTAFGRRLYVDPERPYRGCNYRIQGSAGCMLKRAMIAGCKYIAETGLDARLVMTMHDELIWEVRKEHAYKWFIRGLKMAMEDHGGAFRIPLPVDVERSNPNWDSKADVKL